MKPQLCSPLGPSSLSRILLPVVATFAVSTCTPSTEPADSGEFPPPTIRQEVLEPGRLYTLAIPASYTGDESVPLVLALHYGGHGAPYFGRGVLTGLVEPALRELEAIIVAPDCTGKRASGLVRQLLAFSRQQMIEPKVIEVNNLIVDLDRMLRRLIGEDINVEIKLDTNLGNIKADPGQLEQILVNIVVNGRDAINQRTSISGEKKITIETSNVYLDKEYVKTHPGSREGMHICVSISDTGIGMEKDIQAKVFEPFFTTKDKIKGTGLGLATVYGIVKQNHGYIYVYSELNKGTSVRVYWPIESNDKIQRIMTQSKPDVTGGKETILFVEDNEEVRKFTVTALKTLGYKVLSASHGVEALKMIEQNTVRIDLIITDVVMPEMGGKELSEKILKISPDAKILFTSGYTDNHIVHSGTLDEDVDFIHKPFSIEGLSKKIRNVLDL